MDEALQVLVSSLTSREMQVFKFLGKGYSNPEIAEALCITLSTAKAHVSNVLAKLKVDNRSKVAVIATKILETDPEIFSVEVVNK
ncbi:MAG: LuxR C-terminal-related transcriptional regulator [Fusobacterium sp.]|nr:LuxR C-terminal-related transcriptional regulator [Fusobacterium sp.]